MHRDIDNYIYHCNSKTSVAVVFNLTGSGKFSLWKRPKSKKVKIDELAAAVANDEVGEFLSSLYGEPKTISLTEGEILAFRSVHYHFAEATSSRTIFQFNAGFCLNQMKRGEAPYKLKIKVN